MGKYSKVNASNMQTQATKALSELNFHNLSDSIQVINNKGVLNSSANKVLSDALSNITERTSLNGSIPNLKKYLNNLKEASSYIMKYQTLEKEINNLYALLARAKEKEALSIRSQIRQKENSLKSYEQKIDNLLSK